MSAENYFVELNNINVNEHTEKKGKLTYLSWSWAWAEVKKLHPDANYTIYKNADGWFYHTDGRTCWVETGVTVNGIEHIEYLPVMDNQNRSIGFDRVTSTDVNKAIQRSLTKAVARHGLGLYIYAGEDLPEAEAPDKLSGLQSETILALCNKTNTLLPKLLAHYGKSKLDELTEEQAANAIEILESKVKE